MDWSVVLAASAALITVIAVGLALTTLLRSARLTSIRIGPMELSTLDEEVDEVRHRLALDEAVQAAKQGPVEDKEPSGTIVREAPSPAQEERLAQERREQLDRERRAETEEREYRLLAEYHAQGLAQSKMSFRLSLIFAGLGFLVIAVAIGLAVASDDASTIASIVPLIGGAVVEAVSGLFFVQSNRARQLMVTFFDRLRADRNLREALELAAAIEDGRVRSRLQAQMALSMAGASQTEGTLDLLLREPPPTPSG